MTAANFLSVLAGKDPAVSSGSGKVIKSGPDDRVFVYYADHGAPGTTGSCKTASKNAKPAAALCDEPSILHGSSVPVACDMIIPSGYLPYSMTKLAVLSEHALANSHLLLSMVECVLPCLIQPASAEFGNI